MNSPAAFELKAILDVAGAMIIVTDLAGNVRIFNLVTERLLGWRAAEVVGKQTPAFWHDAGEVAARAAELSKELGRNVSPGFEVFMPVTRDQLIEQRQWTFTREDSSRFPLQLVVFAVRDAAGLHISGWASAGEGVSCEG